jgi:hypothetical protein
MDLIFRSIRHPPDERSMGQVYSFRPAPGCDAISATANTEGFTPLLSIDRHFNWDRDIIKRAASSCNTNGQVCVVELTPILFLVPATKGHGDAAFLIRDLIWATKSAKINSLHFTHFSFMQNRLPESEIVAVLNYLLGDSSVLGLDRLVIDIDARQESHLYKLLRPSLDERHINVGSGC